MASGDDGLHEMRQHLQTARQITLEIQSQEWGNWQNSQDLAWIDEFLQALRFVENEVISRFPDSWDRAGIRSQF